MSLTVPADKNDGNMEGMSWNSAYATLTCNINDIYCVTSLGNDDMGADDCEAALMSVKKWMVNDKEYNIPLNLHLPADAFKDNHMMEHVMTCADPEATLLDDFNDLMHQNFKERVAGGGLSFFARMNVRQTGLTDIAGDKQVDMQLEEHLDGEMTVENIKVLQEAYGQEHLEQMSDSDFYNLYKMHYSSQ